jgi:hypothetical protein
VEQRWWNACGFAGAGRRFEHQVNGIPQMAQDFGNG